MSPQQDPFQFPMGTAPCSRWQGAVLGLCLSFSSLPHPLWVPVPTRGLRKSLDLITVLNKPDVFAASTLISQHHQGQIHKPLDI